MTVTVMAEYGQDRGAKRVGADLKTVRYTRNNKSLAELCVGVLQPTPDSPDFSLANVKVEVAESDDPDPYHHAMLNQSEMYAINDAATHCTYTYPDGRRANLRPLAKKSRRTAAELHPSAKKREGNLPKFKTDFLNSWFVMNCNNPYPSTEQKQTFCNILNLDTNQINNWFINARRRRRRPTEKNLQESGAEPARGELTPSNLLHAAQPSPPPRNSNYQCLVSLWPGDQLAELWSADTHEVCIPSEDELL